MVLLVAAGGALGAVARYGTVVAVGRITGFGFPWGTVTVNLAGSFALGFLIGALAHGFSLTQHRCNTGVCAVKNMAPMLSRFGFKNLAKTLFHLRPLAFVHLVR